MMFTKPFKEKIRAGAITVSFRRWKRPQAKIGGVYKLHPEGAIRVLQVDVLSATDIDPPSAVAAGFESADAVRGFLDAAPDDSVYRVEFELVRDAATLARLSATPELSAEDAVEKLDRMDSRSAVPWTAAVMGLIETHPETRAADLAAEVNTETPVFKANVRKLKKLGLTRSFEVGYALTGLGHDVLRLRASTANS